MATKMATVEKAEELLEKLRSASWSPAVQGGHLQTWLMANKYIVPWLIV